MLTCNDGKQLKLVHVYQLFNYNYVPALFNTWHAYKLFMYEVSNEVQSVFMVNCSSIFFNFIVFIEVVTRQSTSGINVADIRLLHTGLLIPVTIFWLNRVFIKSLFNRNKLTTS